jgi:hypothetical protein
MRVGAATRLSVIVLADRYATIRRVVEHLRAQTVASEIELVVACPFPNGFDLPAGPNGLAAVRLVESPLLPQGPARAAAVRAAAAPVVVLGETHTFPEPAWAERLLSAHDAAWAGVAPGIRNANPDGVLSWSSFLMDYGHWLAEASGADEIQGPPAYNGSWKREALLACGDRLPELLEPGQSLHAEIAARGGRFSHEPAARIAHLNVTRRGAWVAERYFAGRLVAARRSRHWSPARRFVYFGGSVLVPLIRIVRTRPAVRLAGRGTRLPRGTSAAIALGAVLWAAGEAVGFLAGAGRAEARMLEYEVHKERYA